MYDHQDYNAGFEVCLSWCTHYPDVFAYLILFLFEMDNTCGIHEKISSCLSSERLRYNCERIKQIKQLGVVPLPEHAMLTGYEYLLRFIGVVS